jgi:hypothetical protein
MHLDAGSTSSIFCVRATFQSTLGQGTTLTEGGLKICDQIVGIF